MTERILPCTLTLYCYISYFFSTCRLENVELIPAIFGKFIDGLIEETVSQPLENIWTRGDQEILILQGTPFSPQKIEYGVILMKMTNEDEAL